MTAIAEQVCRNIVGVSLPGQLPNGSGLPFPASFGILGNGWISLSLLALLTSLLALVVFYMVANFLRNQQLLAWCKFELFQIFGTATIMIFGITWVVGMCTFDMKFLEDPSAGITDYHGRNMYQIVDDYFSRMETAGSILFGQMMYVSKIITLLQKVTYFSSPLGLGMNDNPMDSLGQLNSILFFMVSGFITSYLLLGLQARIMEYMATAILFYLFPFGIFFRSFEPTRGFGGTLVGLSLAFFLFYPVAIVFNDYITRPTLTLEQQVALANQAEARNAVDAANSKIPTEKELKDNIGQLNDRVKARQMVNGVSSSVFVLLKGLVFYVIAAVIMPVLNFIILVEIAKGMTKIMGDELDVSNLTRLI